MILNAGELKSKTLERQKDFLVLTLHTCNSATISTSSDLAILKHDRLSIFIIFV